MMRRLSFFAFVLMTIAISPTIAQMTDCPAIIRHVMAGLDQTCAATERNEACYGHIAINAQAQAEVNDFRFEQISDIENVMDIAALRLRPLDAANDIWGVALMQLQTSLPDTLDGQNVTFVLFGDTEVVNLASEGGPQNTPMQAFYLRTSLSEISCNQAPASGLLVRTPKGVGEIQFSLNGVDVMMGSTLFFRSEPGGLLTIDTYTGSALIHTPYGDYPMVAGTRLAFPVNADSVVSGAPAAPLAPHDARLSPILDDLYPALNAPPPLTPSQMGVLNTLLENDLPPCDAADFLPDCSTLIESAGGQNCRINADGVTFTCGAAGDMIWNGDAFPVYETVSVWEGLPLDTQIAGGEGNTVTNVQFAAEVAVPVCARDACPVDTPTVLGSAITDPAGTSPVAVPVTASINNGPDVTPYPIEPDLLEVTPPDVNPTGLP